MNQQDVKNLQQDLTKSFEAVNTLMGSISKIHQDTLSKLSDDEKKVYLQEFEEKGARNMMNEFTTKIEQLKQRHADISRG